LWWVLGIYPCTVEEVRHSQQKELRIIDTLEPVMSTHRLVVDQKLIQKDYDTARDPKYALFYQLTRVTKDRGALIHDDRLDALAIAVNYWTEHMARDNDKAVSQIKSSLLKDELKSFMRSAIGRPQTRPTWHSNNVGLR
jgi:hypothetical protein